MSVAERGRAHGPKAGTYPRADHRDRLLRPRNGHRIAAAGRGLPDSGEGRRRRRHLADNTYPDCACDVPSHLYSFSFEPKATWSKLAAARDPGYLQGVTDKYGLRRYIRFNSRAARAHWDHRVPLARVHRHRAGVRRAVPHLGCGRAAHSRVPDIEGLAEFDGPAFHSAQWDHDVDLTGSGSR